MILATFGVCLAGIALLLAADFSGRRWLEWVGKPAASCAFIVAALHWGALDSVYGLVVLFGLVLGAVGDVLLIPDRQDAIFLGGMVAFLGGHLAFAVAFGLLPLDAIAAIGAALLLAAGAWPLLRWLMPSVPYPLRAPVLAYLVVISAMTIIACGATAAGASILIAGGAVAFAVSDLSVARDRFVQKVPINRIWGIPLYYAAQMAIAASVATVG